MTTSFELFCRLEGVKPNAETRRLYQRYKHQQGISDNANAIADEIFSNCPKGGSLQEAIDKQQMINPARADKIARRIALLMIVEAAIEVAGTKRFVKEHREDNE